MDEEEVEDEEEEEEEEEGPRPGPEFTPQTVKGDFRQQGRRGRIKLSL